MLSYQYGPTFLENGKAKEGQKQYWYGVPNNPLGVYILIIAEKQYNHIL